MASGLDIYDRLDGSEAFLIGNVQGLGDGFLASVLPKYWAAYTDVFKADPSDVCEKIKERMLSLLKDGDDKLVKDIDSMSFELKKTDDDLVEVTAKISGKDLSSSDIEMLSSFSRFLRIQLGDITGIYTLSDKLTESTSNAISAFYTYVVFDIVFIEFEGYMVMAVFGSDE